MIGATGFSGEAGRGHGAGRGRARSPSFKSRATSRSASTSWPALVEEAAASARPRGMGHRDPGRRITGGRWTRRRARPCCWARPLRAVGANRRREALIRTVALASARRASPARAVACGIRLLRDPRRRRRRRSQRSCSPPRTRSSPSPTPRGIARCSPGAPCLPRCGCAERGLGGTAWRQCWESKHGPHALAARRTPAPYAFCYGRAETKSPYFGRNRSTTSVGFAE